jgi:hypothetical protein
MTPRVCFADIESNNLMPMADTIWCICCKVLGDPTVYSFMDKDDFLSWFNSEGIDVLVFHNGLGFDFQCMRKVWGVPFSVEGSGLDLFNGRSVTIIDTFQTSMYLNADRHFGHSIEKWGEHLGEPKMDFRKALVEAGALDRSAPDGEEFRTFHPLMVQYCSQDVRVLEKVYKALDTECGDLLTLAKTRPYIASKKSFWLMGEQAITGVGFDKEFAESLVVRIEEVMTEIENEIEPQLPQRKLNKGETDFWRFPAKPFKKDGGLASSMYKWMEKTGATLAEDSDEGAAVVILQGKRYNVVGGAETVTHGTMHLKNQDDLKEWLLSKGWKPTLWNVKKDARGKPVRDERGRIINTSPKFQEMGNLCPNLDEMEGDLVKPVIKWLSLRNRKSVIEGLLGDQRLAYDGRLSAGSAGLSNTFRQRHTKIVNFPKADPSVTLGYEMRSLIRASRPGYAVVGYDAAGLENRVEAHYCYPYEGGKEYADEILDGDPHTKNAFIFYGDEILENIGWTHKGEADKDDPRFKKFRSKSKNGRYCVPMDTKCLIKSKGWVGYESVEEGDTILGYDPVSKTKKWTKVTGKVYYPSAEVWEFKTKWFNFRATPEHRWFVKQRKWGLRAKKASFSMADSAYEVRTTEELTTESSIIVNAPMDPSQDTEVLRSRMIQGKYGIHWTQHVLDMSQQQRINFLEGFVIADGHFKDDGGWQWSQIIGELSEAALTASYLVSDNAVQVSEDKRKATKNPMICAKLSNKAHRGLQTAQKTVLEDQPVWCVQTELGSWVMRQGNVITITGNCLSYGGGPPKLASTLGVPSYKGQELYDAFWDGNVPLKTCKERLIQHWKTDGGSRRIKTIDGRWCQTRSEHSLLNVLFQSTGALVMDYAALFMDKWLGGLVLDDDGVPCYKYKGRYLYRVIYMHDEYMWEVPLELAEEIGRLGVLSIQKAGEFFKMNVPLTGEAKVGLNWAEVH